LVDTPYGQDWFIHFQDKGPYGRVVHLQPVQWKDGWPIIGIDQDGDGIGEPVERFGKPKATGRWPVITPPDSDRFDRPCLGLQWQWHANPQPNWAFPTGLGFMRLFCVQRPDAAKNLWDVPNLLLQKFPAPAFTATTKLTFRPMAVGDMAGLLIMGTDYAYIALCKGPDGLAVRQVTCKDADKGQEELEVESRPIDTNQVYLRVKVGEDAVCRFSFSLDGVQYQQIGDPFVAKKGRWIGAKVGIFTLGSQRPAEMGYADYDWFMVD
jgi:beta-xylosidase